MIVVGYLPSEKRPFRSLHCAVEEDGRLRYVGGVGTGFSGDELDRAKARLDEDRRKSPPSDLDRAETAPKGLVWVDPKWRIEVRTGGWTGDGNLRQARFLGWREDRAPRSAKKAEPAMPAHNDLADTLEAKATKPAKARRQAAATKTPRRRSPMPMRKLFSPASAIPTG